MVDANIFGCCSLEIEVKGVMFYEGKSLLDPSRFQKVYFSLDHKNLHHAKAYWVQYCENDVVLGHLSRAAADSWYYVTNIPSVKYSAVCISGRVYPNSGSYQYRVTNVLVSISAELQYHNDVLECLEVFSVPFEEYLPKWLMINCK